MLEAAGAPGVARVVNSSTGGAIYGDADRVPTPEDQARRPMSPYGQSKFAAEGYCGLYGRLYGMSVVSLRYANIYGPRQDPHGEGGVVAIFCGKLLEGGTPAVFGDGLQTRDYVYVGDVVAANLAAGRLEVEGAYNVGTGVETSVLDLIARAARRWATGGRSSPSTCRSARARSHRSCVDPSRAREALGWEARVALGEGLERTLAPIRGLNPAGRGTLAANSRIGISASRGNPARRIPPACGQPDADTDPHRPESHRLAQAFLALGDDGAVGPARRSAKLALAPSPLRSCWPPRRRWPGWRPPRAR